MGQTPSGRETDGCDSNAGRLGETSKWAGPDGRKCDVRGLMGIKGGIWKCQVVWTRSNWCMYAIRLGKDNQKDNTFKKNF